VDSKKRATLKDVALLAETSVGTVSNVLNRPAYVNEDLRKRVLLAMRLLKFEPTLEARKYRKGRAINVGLVLADMSNPFFTSISVSAESETRNINAGLVMCHSDEDVEREAQNIELLIQHRVQGIILAPVANTTQNFKKLLERNFPVVLVDRVPAKFSGCSVTSDDFEGGRIAGEHFKELGFKKIALLSNPSKSEKMKQRIAGFQGSFKGVDGEVTFELIKIENWSFAEGVVAGNVIAKRATKDLPRAIFCANDLVAMGLLQSLQRAKIDVPGEIAIMGFDDIEAASEVTIPITTLRQPLDELGRLAMRLLYEEISQMGNHVHTQQMLSPELIIRESTKGS
jgi:LacI family transcriptional regulator